MCRAGGAAHRPLSCNSGARNHTSSSTQWTLPALLSQWGANEGAPSATQVVGHHPVYSSGGFHGDTAELQELLDPVLRKYGVQVRRSLEVSGCFPAHTCRTESRRQQSEPQTHGGAGSNEDGAAPDAPQITAYSCGGSREVLVSGDVQVCDTTRVVMGGSANVES